MDMLLRAAADAERYHKGQVRFGTSIPYLSHPLGTCALVFGANGTEIEAAAALLHDAPDHVELPDTVGADVLAEIEARYGDDVEHIVQGCSEELLAPGESRLPWRERKARYIQLLRSADASTMLVSAADKLENLRSIHDEWLLRGEIIWEHIHVPPDRRENFLWNYRALYDVYVADSSPFDPRRRRLTTPMLELLVELSPSRVALE